MSTCTIYEDTHICLFAFKSIKILSNVTGWAFDVKNLLNSLGFAYLLDNENIARMQLNAVIKRLYDQYFQEFYADIRASPKMVAYNKIKQEFKVEKYLLCVNN